MIDCSNLTLSGSSGTSCLVPKLFETTSGAWIGLGLFVLIGAAFFILNIYVKREKKLKYRKDIKTEK